MADESKLGKWGDMDLDELFKHDPEAHEALQRNLAILEKLPDADPFLLAHLAIDETARFGEELEASGKTGTPMSGGRMLNMISKLIFSNTLLAKRILIDHPVKLIVDSSEAN